MGSEALSYGKSGGSGFWRLLREDKENYSISSLDSFNWIHYGKNETMNKDL